MEPLNDEIDDEPTVKNQDELTARYPVQVVLRFRDEEAKKEFMGQLSDGWGENLVMLEWPWEQYAKGDDGDCGEAFHEQPAFGVDLQDQDY